MPGSKEVFISNLFLFSFCFVLVLAARDKKRANATIFLLLLLLLQRISLVCGLEMSQEQLRPRVHRFARHPIE
jgi:energy-converting hydrogenase Eha subunit F